MREESAVTTPHTRGRPDPLLRRVQAAGAPRPASSSRDHARRAVRRERHMRAYLAALRVKRVP